MPLSQAEFDYVRDLVRRGSAMVLEPDKAYRIELCLQPLARQEGLASVQELLRQVRSSANNGLHRKVVEAMTINETSFFRDHYPFEALRREVIPHAIARRRRERRLDIWCAACSTGQEAYSIAMVLHEYFPELLSWNIRLLATDLAQSVLERAQQARYTQLEVNRGLPAAMLVKYFTREGMHWQLSESIRRMVEFQPFNLAGATPFPGLFDIVFLRNVLIYFPLETKREVLQRLKRVLRTEAVLFLGGAETTLQLSDSFHRVPFDRHAYYRVGEFTPIPGGEV